MDAKPQRPLRSFKVRDENLPLNGSYPSKSLHQRNKSSPALSTLASQQGALKTGARRTVFADLSNTNRANQVVKDDSVLANTKSALHSLKEVGVQDLQSSRPAAPLLRPAQRPLSVSGIKGLFNTFTSTASTAANKASFDPLNTQGALEVLPGATKPKKSTAVFKDSAIATSEPVPSLSEDVENILPNILPNQIESNPHLQLPRKPSSNIPFQSQSYERRLPPLPPPSDDYDVLAEGVHVHGSYGLPPSQFDHILDPLSHQDMPSYIVPPREPLQPIDEKAVPPIGPRNPDAAHILPVSDLYEYWEDEAYAEQYEDDGYTTARSLKSRGDYSTGSTTVLLAPRMTAKVQNELAAAKAFVQESHTAEDIEEDESWDTSMVAEYGEEIFEYMRTLEERMRPNPYYMDNQTEVQWSMRSVLMDWLVQVHNRFALLPETLFLCVNYIDRFLSCKVVSLGKLQLVGATAIFVAAKYEEINCPSVSEIQYMVDGGYTVEEILKAERFMLSMLQFELGWPGPMSFLRRISKADDYDLETRTLAKYFLEITIMDERFVGCIPSYTAAGAHCLARLMLGKGSWSQAHVYYSNYTYSQLRPLLSAIISCCDDPQKHHSAVFDKYGDKRFKRASYFVQSEMSKGFFLPLTQRASTSIGFGIEKDSWRGGSAARVEVAVGDAIGRFL